MKFIVSIISDILDYIYLCMKWSLRLQYTHYYAEVDGKPTLFGIVRDATKPDHAFRLTAIFTPEGYEAYYAYGGNIKHSAEKLATRKYVRKGAAVPIEQH